VAFDQPADGVATQLPAFRSGEQWVACHPAALVEPGPQYRPGFPAERGDPFLASFASAAHVGAGAELDRRACEASELADAQARFEGEQQHGVVTPPDPGCTVWGGQQGRRFVLGDVGDGYLVGSLRRDGEHALDERGVLGMPVGGESEQRPDRGEPGVATLAPSRYQRIRQTTAKLWRKSCALGGRGRSDDASPASRTRRGKMVQTLSRSSRVPVAEV